MSKPQYISIAAMLCLFFSSCISDIDDFPLPPDDDSSSSVESSSSSEESSSSSSADETVQIGNQTWMAKNLDFPVPGSKCGGGDNLIDGNNTTCDTYGRLYNWATAMALSPNCNNLPSSDPGCTIGNPHQGICPEGWHIPSNADWDELYRFVDGFGTMESPYISATAGTKLKAERLWTSGGVPRGTGDSGFAALPGGKGGNPIGKFQDIGKSGYWWSASEKADSEAWYRIMYNDSEIADNNYGDKKFSFSVRCLKDPAPPSEGE